MSLADRSWAAPVYIAGAPGAGKTEAIRAVSHMRSVLVVDGMVLVSAAALPRWLAIALKDDAAADMVRRELPNAPIIRITRDAAETHPTDIMVYNTGTIADLHVAFRSTFRRLTSS